MSRRIHRALHRSLGGQPVAPLVVSVVAMAAGLVWVAVGAPQAEPWVWAAAAAPVMVHLLGLARLDRSRRRSQEGVASAISLREADLGGEELASTDLRHRDLASARLIETNLAHADLTRSNLSGARLLRANLLYASLTGAQCGGASFHGADCREATLDRLQARGTTFDRADLRHASLVGADLRGASLVGADLRGATMVEADLRRADLTRAIVDRSAMAGAIIDPTTILRNRRARPRTGAARSLDLVRPFRPTTAGTGPAGPRWGARALTSTQAGPWALIRPVLVGLVGASVVAGSVASNDLPQELPSALVTATPEGRAAGDHPEVLDDFGVAASAAGPGSIQSPAGLGGADSGLPDLTGERSAGTASDAGAEADGPGIDLPAAIATGGGGAGGAAESAPSGGGGRGSGGAKGAPPEDADLDEGPQVLGLVVERGLHVVMASEGGSSTASFDSPIGFTTLRVGEDPERLDFDGAPPGEVTVTLSPEDGAVASCAIAVDGVEAAQHRGEPGEPVTCQVDIASDDPP